MGDKLTNLDGFGDPIEPPEEIQPQEPPEQPPQVSGDDFTEVINSIEDINRDDLSPEMQGVYDWFLSAYSNMHGDYTRKTQDIAQVRRDAETWQMVAQHQDLLNLMSEAIYRKQQGLPVVGEQQQSQQQPTPDPNQDPVGFIRDVVRTEMKGILSEALPPLQQGLQQVTGFVQNNQAKLEFDNLANLYPAAKGIGMDELSRIQSQYRDASGRPVSMETALHIYAQGNPAVLQRTQRQAPAVKPKVAPVEKPQQQRGSTVQTPLPEGVRKLQDDVKARQKDGTIANLGAAVQRAIAKFRE